MRVRRNKMWWQKKKDEEEKVRETGRGRRKGSVKLRARRRLESGGKEE